MHHGDVAAKAATITIAAIDNATASRLSAVARGSERTVQATATMVGRIDMTPLYLAEVARPAAPADSHVLRRWPVATSRSAKAIASVAKNDSGTSTVAKCE